MICRRGERAREHIRRQDDAGDATCGIVGPRRAEAAAPSVAADRGRQPGPAELHADAVPPSPASRRADRSRRRCGRSSSPRRTPGQQARPVSQAPAGQQHAGEGVVVVDRRHEAPPPDGNAGESSTARPARRIRRARRSRGPSCSRSRGDRRAASRSPVSTMPSGSNTRSCRKTSRGWPAARATSTPSTSEPVL